MSEPKASGGRGLLLVFLSGENIADKTELFTPSPIQRTNSNLIVTKAQSTISICFLLVCLTFLLFTLSTFEPTIAPSTINPSRRLMLDLDSKPRPNSSIALQGLGTLYRRGTRAMDDLIVGHLVEDVTATELRLFLRLLHRSGLTAKADLVLIFDSRASASKFAPVIEEENDSFLRLLHRYSELNGTVTKSAASFQLTHFVKSGKTEKEPTEPLWGKKTRSNHSGPGGGDGETESTRLSYGSVVSFDVPELDPENSLSGFLTHVPMSLRRWACYPMLLGRVKRSFKHTMLVDVKKFLLLGDPFGRAGNRGSDSVHLSTKTERSYSKHGKKTLDKTRSLNSGLVIGGSRGVRRLSNAMVTEVARAAMVQHKKNPVTESGVLNQLGRNDMLLKSKNVNLVTSTEPIPDSSRLNSSFHSAPSVVQRGNGNGNNGELSELIMKQICSLEVDSKVYRDC